MEACLQVYHVIVCRQMINDLSMGKLQYYYYYYYLF